MKKSKFSGLNFDSLEKLSKDEQKKIVGGYGNSVGGGGLCSKEKKCSNRVYVMGEGWQSNTSDCSCSTYTLNGETKALYVCPLVSGTSCS